MDGGCLLAAGMGVPVFVMLVNSIGVVPEADDRPSALAKELQGDCVGDRRRRLTAAESDPEIGLDVDEDFSLSCRHKSELTKKRQ